MKKNMNLTLKLIWLYFLVIFNMVQSIYAAPDTLYKNGFSINPTDGNLPIVLEQFSITREKTTFKIYWTTTSEINCNYFLLSTSKDGENFTVISKMPGAGNSLSTKEYCVNDNHPLSGTFYYRLSLIDYTGAERFYKPVEVSWEPSNAEILGVEKISPNPFIKELTVDFFCKKEQKVKLEIVNLQGIVVCEKEINATANYNTAKLTEFNGHDSVYFLFLTCDEWRTKGFKLIREGK